MKSEENFFKSELKKCVGQYNKNYILDPEGPKTRTNIALLKQNINTLYLYFCMKS